MQQRSKNQQNPKRALLIGRDYFLAWTLPQLLARAGFSVDVVSSSRVMSRCKFVQNCDIVSFRQSLIPVIVERMKKHYDWVIITEDGLLTDVLQSNLSLEVKLRILPVQQEKDFAHLYSKIGLSRMFSAEGVCTPLFAVVHNLPQALSEAEQLGYPLLLKRDSSCGGNGIFEINSSADLHSIDSDLFHKSILLQKKITGIELDLSALYFEGNLIHFNYAKVEKTCWKFGISSIRTYHPISLVDEQIFQELAHIGKVLGAHGFTNIGCIQAEERRFYFEADMRPNVWVEFPKFFGEDPAIRIRKWFLSKETLNYPASLASDSLIVLPYFLRLKWFELLFNRYNVWRYIPWDDYKLTLRLIRISLFSFGLKSRFILLVKWVIPPKHHKHFRKWKSLCLSRFSFPTH